MRIYLIRHGETAFNKARVMQGHSPVPLNAVGVDQASRLGRRLATMPLDHIYASDLERTRMTASILAEATGASITYEPLFRERDPGELCNLSYDECEVFFLDPAYEPPGGESEAVFVARVQRAFAWLADREAGLGRHVAVVSHGMVCRAFMQAVVNDPAFDLAAAAWPNASLTIARYDGTWVAERVGDADHLDEASAHPVDKTGA